VTAGNRSGSLAISSNAIDALLFGTAGASALAPGVLSLAGVFTDPAFQVVVRALNQQKGVDLLSSPRVTTKSGSRAVIEIIREFRYPTEFDPPQIPQTFGNNNGGVTILDPTNPLGSGPSSNSFPVTPTTPTSFETRNTGVTLEVEPTVGPDGYTIDLNLVPQVVEFEGFVNYGSPIQTSSTDILGRQIVNIITPNVINQPIFSTRKVTTRVSVYDGQTVVLGGLMREDVQKVQDKTPLLGDIPLLGRLFRSNVDQHIKRNLIIFVSARLMNPAGEPVRRDEEEEEEIELAPPPEASSPLPELPLMSK
jgi:general secretion pathway protein D